MADFLLKTMVLKNVIKDSSCIKDQEELFQERQSSGEMNSDNVTKHLLVTLEHSSTLSSFKDTPTETELLTVQSIN